MARGMHRLSVVMAAPERIVPPHPQGHPQGLSLCAGEGEHDADPVEAALAAGLRYVADAMPGLRRKRAGKHFSYAGVKGNPICDPDELRRVVEYQTEARS